MVTTFLVPKNNAYGTLLAAIVDDASELTLQSGEGDLRFPSTFPFVLSIDSEILNATGRTGDTITGLTHAHEGTAASGHAIGALVEVLITAKQIEDLQDAVNTLEAVDHDADAIAAVPSVTYISFGTEPLTGQSYAP